MRRRGLRVWSAAAGAAFVAVLAIVVAGGAARAGLLDDAPPEAGNGKPGVVVYRMGAIHHDAGHAELTVTCTNLGAEATQVVLEVYDENDRRAAPPAHLRLAPHATGTFASARELPGTGDTAPVALPPIEHGKARVSAKRGDVACTALMHLRGAGGETRQLPLTLLKRVAPAGLGGTR